MEIDNTDRGGRPEGTEGNAVHSSIIKQGDYAIFEEPYYEPVGSEITDFEIAYRRKRPLSLIGPTGCGKTTLTTYMAWKLSEDIIYQGKDGMAVSKLSEAEKQPDGRIMFPYIEIPCHEDLNTNDLVGRYDFSNNWIPGPLYIGATQGGIVVLDEIVEARKDAIVLLHGLTDDRRALTVSKKGEVVLPPDNFMVVICYNPGYQIKAKDLKPSTRQRFPTVEMNYPPQDIEKKILMKKTGIDEKIAGRLVSLGNTIRESKDSDTLNLQEGASTRLLLMAAEYYLEYEKMGLKPDLAHIARITIFNPISTEETDKKALEEMLSW